MKRLFPWILGETPFVAVDVGASHGLQPHWAWFAGEFDFVLIEPDPNACVALEEIVSRLPHRHEAQHRVVSRGVSGTGGRRTLHVTNQPTGSSLLKPRDITQEDFDCFYYDPDYFIPIRPRDIETVRLGDAVRESGWNAMHMVKLDTQGTEIEIMAGLDDAMFDGLVAVEMEVGVGTGGYENRPSLDDAIAFMRGKGFQLFDMNEARHYGRLRGRWIERKHDAFSFAEADPRSFVWRLWEVDAVFMRNPEALIEARDVLGFRRLLAALSVYRLFGEAFELTGLGQREGLISYAEACRFRADLRHCHEWLAQSLRNGHYLHWSH